MSLLVVCKIWRLFVNILTHNDKYSLSKNYCLTKPIQMHLSQSQQMFSQFFAAFGNLYEISNTLQNI